MRDSNPPPGLPVTPPLKAILSVLARVREEHRTKEGRRYEQRRRAQQGGPAEGRSRSNFPSLSTIMCSPILPFGLDFLLEPRAILSATDLDRQRSRLDRTPTFDIVGADYWEEEWNPQISIVTEQSRPQRRSRSLGGGVERPKSLISRNRRGKSQPVVDSGDDSETDDRALDNVSICPSNSAHRCNLICRDFDISVFTSPSDYQLPARGRLLASQTAVKAASRCKTRQPLARAKVLGDGGQSGPSEVRPSLFCNVGVVAGPKALPLLPFCPKAEEVRIRFLILEGTGVQSNDWKGTGGRLRALLKALEPTLECLMLLSARLTPSQCSAISASFINCRYLKYIKISDLQFVAGSEGGTNKTPLQLIIEGCTPEKLQNQLVVVDLSSNPLSKMPYKWLVSPTRSSTRPSISSLRTLNLSFAKVDHNVVKSVFTSLPLLESLSLRAVKMSDRVMVALCEGLTSRQRPSLSNKYNVKSKVESKNIANRGTPPNNYLRCLDVSCNPLSDIMLKRLVAALCGESGQRSRQSHQHCSLSFLGLAAALDVKVFGSRGCRSKSAEAFSNSEVGRQLKVLLSHARCPKAVDLSFNDGGLDVGEEDGPIWGDGAQGSSWKALAMHIGDILGSLSQENTCPSPLEALGMAASPSLLFSASQWSYDIMEGCRALLQGSTSSMSLRLLDLGVVLQGLTVRRHRELIDTELLEVARLRGDRLRIVGIDKQYNLGSPESRMETAGQLSVKEERTPQSTLGHQTEGDSDDEQSGSSDTATAMTSSDDDENKADVAGDALEVRSLRCLSSPANRRQIRHVGIKESTKPTTRKRRPSHNNGELPMFPCPVSSVLRGPSSPYLYSLENNTNDRAHEMFFKEPTSRDSQAYCRVESPHILRHISSIENTFIGGAPKTFNATRPEDIASVIAKLGMEVLRVIVPARTQRGVGDSALHPLLTGDKLHILVALKLILREITAVTFPDLYLLDELKNKTDKLTPIIHFLTLVTLEELPLLNLTLKYQRFGILESDDRLVVPGLVFHDGGPTAQAIHSSEFRLLWLRRHDLRYAMSVTQSENNQQALASQSNGMTQQIPTSSQSTSGSQSRKGRTRGPPSGQRDPSSDNGRGEGHLDVIKGSSKGGGGDVPYGGGFDRNDDSGSCDTFEGDRRDLRGSGRRRVGSNNYNEGEAEDDTWLPIPRQRPQRDLPAVSSRLEQRKNSGPEFPFGSIESFLVDKSFCQSIAPFLYLSPMDLFGTQSNESSPCSSVCCPHGDDPSDIRYGISSDISLPMARHVDALASNCCCRETIVVDSQSDYRLRKLISAAQSLKASILPTSDHASNSKHAGPPPPSKTVRFIEALRAFVSRRIRFERNASSMSIPTPTSPSVDIAASASPVLHAAVSSVTTSGAAGHHLSSSSALTSSGLPRVSRQARVASGFVNIGDIRVGASRHMAILFKVLCDATDIPCKLVRRSSGCDGEGPEAAYNLVMIKSDLCDSAIQAPSDSPHNVGGVSSRSSGSADSHLETMYPIWWRPKSPPPSTSRSCSPPAPVTSLRDTNVKSTGRRLPIRDGPERSRDELANSKASTTNPLPSRLRNKLEDLFYKVSAREVDAELNLDDVFYFVGLLGKGSFGEVWKVRLKSANKSNENKGAKQCSSVFAVSSPTLPNGEVTSDDDKVKRRGRPSVAAVGRYIRREKSFEPRGRKRGPVRRGRPAAKKKARKGEVGVHNRAKGGGSMSPATRSACDSDDRSGHSDGSPRDLSQDGSSAEPEDRKLFALKLVPYTDENVPEAELLRNYSHPRVIAFLGVFKGYQILLNRQRKQHKGMSLCFLMELADFSLEQILQETQQPNSNSARGRGQDDQQISENVKPAVPIPPITPDFIRCVLLDTARAMAFLHRPSPTKPHLLHRDLKPANILLRKEPSGAFRAFVSDFGVARVFEAFDDNMTVGPGTEGYIAPEQHSPSYDRPVDVWSFGVIIARLLGVEGWKSITIRVPSVDEFERKDEFFIKLCLSCLAREPLLRPTFDQVVRDILDEVFRVEFIAIIRSSTKHIPAALCDDPARSNGWIPGLPQCGPEIDKSRRQKELEGSVTTDGRQSKTLPVMLGRTLPWDDRRTATRKA